MTRPYPSEQAEKVSVSSSLEESTSARSSLRSQAYVAHLPQTAAHQRSHSAPDANHTVCNSYKQYSRQVQ